MGNQKQIKVWQYIHTNKKIIDNIKQNIRNIIRTHYKYKKIKKILEQLNNDFIINETYGKITNNELNLAI